jgi:hypothetical protein
MTQREEGVENRKPEKERKKKRKRKRIYKNRLEETQHYMFDAKNYER